MHARPLVALAAVAVLSLGGPALAEEEATEVMQRVHALGQAALPTQSAEAAQAKAAALEDAAKEAGFPLRVTITG